MIRLVYHRKNRILEPHDHGILNGSVQLLSYQVGGSSSRPLPNWVLMKANEIFDLPILATQAYLTIFRDRRPARLAMTNFPALEQAEALAMPGHDGFWLDD